MESAGRRSMNVRELLGWTAPYESFNREERNLAAIFFHALNLPGNLNAFLAATGCAPVAAGFSPAIFFEYAYLRDLWFGLSDNDAKCAVIENGLGLGCVPKPSSMPVGDVNRLFGAVPKPSEKFVQNPGNWSVAQFSASIADDDDFLATCIFKWCFNAKPDLVLQTAAERVVCIEAKLESGEGRYPTASAEKEIFRRRGLPSVGQTEVQRHMFERILGYQTEFILLARKRPRLEESHRFLSWGDAFDAMECGELPEFMKRTIQATAG
jgi:hypothetical protein